MQNVMQKNKIAFCLIAYVVFVMFASVGSSPLINVPSTDSSVFIIMGRSLLAGKVMYKEAVDHKGLYTFVINAIAAAITQGGGGLEIYSACS